MNQVPWSSSLTQGILEQDMSIRKKKKKKERDPAWYYNEDQYIQRAAKIELKQRSG